MASPREQGGATAHAGAHDVDVVVVGAGLAGLRTASALRAGGATVCVLEARDRVGGRTWSEAIDGAMLDRGGQWMGPSQDRVAALAQQLSVETFPTFCDGRKVLELGGRRSEYERDIPSINPLALVQMQAALTLLDRQRKKVPVDAPLDAPDALRLDAMTVETFRDRYVKLGSVAGLMDCAIRTIFGAEPGELSALYFLMYLNAGGGLLSLAEIRGGAQQERFVDGAQALSLGLAARLRHDSALDLRLRAPVHRITQDRDGVTVTHAAGEVRGRYAVLAIAPSLAGRIEYEPALSAARDQLTRRMPMGATVKVIVTYARAFWRERGFSGEAISTRGPLTLVFDNTSHDGQTPCLLGFIVGRAARRWSERPERERRGDVLDALDRCFGPDARAPVAYVEQDWSTEPFSGGCPVGIMTPGTLSNAPDVLRSPQGRIHFAGTETATVWTGYMEGALESGERAAAEVLTRL
ncbi:MAG: FAD-dependent oxidoreductase [Myxococcales bacterium]|nr:FAD-dependent oxidoreductase [Myxococcales bacterium]